MTPDELERLAFFAPFAASTREGLAAGSVLREHAAGETILSRAETTDHFIFLIEGRWTMRRFVRGVSEAMVWRDDIPGAWISGVAALEMIAPADVFADRPCRVLVAPRERIHDLLAEDPVFAARILRDIHRWAERLEVHAALTRAKGP